MATAEELRAQIAELDAALAAPERQVTLGSQNVTWRTAQDLITAKRELEAQLAALEPVTSSSLPGRRTAFYRGRGFN